MGDSNILRLAALIQQGETLPKLLELLDDSGTELPAYSKIAPGVPAIHTIPDLRDALAKVGYDPAATGSEYVPIMYAAALTEIAVSQQETIEGLRAEVAE